MRGHNPGLHPPLQILKYKHKKRCRFRIQRLFFPLCSCLLSSMWYTKGLVWVLKHTNRWQCCAAVNYEASWLSKSSRWGEQGSRQGVKQQTANHICVSEPIKLFGDIYSIFQSVDKRLYITVQTTKHDDFNERKRWNPFSFNIYWGGNTKGWEIAVYLWKAPLIKQIGCCWESWEKLWNHCWQHQWVDKWAQTSLSCFISQLCPTCCLGDGNLTAAAAFPSFTEWFNLDDIVLVDGQWQLQGGGIGLHHAGMAVLVLAVHHLQAAQRGRLMNVSCGMESLL